MNFDQDSHLFSLANYYEINYQSSFANRFIQVRELFPKNDLISALSKGQLKSKRWAHEKIHSIWGSNLGLVFILANWYGLLANIMLESRKYSSLRIRGFDIDERANEIADQLSRKWVIEDWTFKAVTADVTELNLGDAKFATINSKGVTVNMVEKPDLIINTSCEHFSEKAFDKWFSSVPSGMRVVVQSNNYFDLPEHLNCVNSLEEFKSRFSLSKEIYAGELELEKYTRFMLIGEK